MITIKQVSMLIAAALITVSAVCAQSGSSDNRREMTVEESYRQEMIEMMIIRETYRVESYDQKMMALQYIGEVIDRGNTGEEIRQILEELSLDGVVNLARENGRVVNNFPMARREAAKHLGKIHTVESRNALIKVCVNDPEPTVVQEAIRSLGEIGNTGSNDERATEAIVAAFNKYNTLNPDNLIALSAVDAIAKLAGASSGTMNRDAVQLLIRVATGPYIPPVREKAMQVSSDLRTGAARNQSSQNSSTQNNSSQNNSTQN